MAEGYVRKAAVRDIAVKDGKAPSFVVLLQPLPHRGAAFVHERAVGCQDRDGRGRQQPGAVGGDRLGEVAVFGPRRTHDAQSRHPVVGDQGSAGEDRGLRAEVDILGISLFIVVAGDDHHGKTALFKRLAGEAAHRVCVLGRIEKVAGHQHRRAALLFGLVAREVQRRKPLFGFFGVPAHQVRIRRVQYLHARTSGTRYLVASALASRSPGTRIRFASRVAIDGLRPRTDAIITF